MTAPMLTVLGNPISGDGLARLAEDTRQHLERPIMAHRRRTGQLWERLAERAETGKA